MSSALNSPTIEGVVQVAVAPEEQQERERSGSTSRARAVAVLVAVIVGVALGALGSALVAPGHSLAVPTAIVAGIGAAIVLVSWVVASFRANRQAGWIFAVTVAAVTVLASVWTFEFALPASVEWSNATAQAQDALNVLARSPQNHDGTVPPHPCTVHATGSIGPLAAPYKACAIWTPEGHLVEFASTSHDARGGLVYTDRPAASFPDQCARHLEGNWWMVASSTDSNGDPGSCFFGYRFFGGG